MSLRALRSFVSPRRADGRARCELCGAPIDAAHPHVAAVEDRTLACACGACAVLFRDARAGRFRTVPDRVLVDREFAPRDDEWATIAPVRLAFFTRRAGAWTAFYPSPGGPVETPWDGALEAIAPLAARVENDVEALLLRRPADCLIVPVDLCYELVGIVRKTWRGFHGGDEAEQAIDAFFTRVRGRAR